MRRYGANLAKQGRHDGLETQRVDFAAFCEAKRNLDVDVEQCPNHREAKHLAEDDEAAIVRCLQRMNARKSAPEWGIVSELM